MLSKVLDVHLISGQRNYFKRLSDFYLKHKFPVDFSSRTPPPQIEKLINDARSSNDYKIISGLLDAVLDEYGIGNDLILPADARVRALNSYFFPEQELRELLSLLKEIDYKPGAQLAPVEGAISQSHDDKEESAFNFPPIALDSATRTWLEAAYSKFKKGERINPAELIVELWGRIPEEFEYKAIDQRLFRSGDPTLLAILQIDPKSVFAEETDRVIRHVRELIRKNPAILTVTANDVSDGTGIPVSEVSNIFKLMMHLGSFWNGATGDKTGAYIEVRIEYEDVKKEYLRYDNLDKLLDRFSKNNESKEQPIPAKRSGLELRKGLTVFKTAFGIYRILNKIGEGGSGVVFKVEDEERNAYAIKCLLPSRLTRLKIDRFKNELFFCLRNKHRNIIQVLDFGVEEVDGVSYPFYVMPFFPSTLRPLIKEGISPDRGLHYFSQMLDAVECAHLLQVVHRDLKPENFLLEPSADLLVLCDFGIAHFSESELHTAVKTQDSERLANFQYAAPEQRKPGETVDARADIFALGLMLNEMITGEIPLALGFKKIDAVAPDYGYLDGLIDSMLQKSPDARPNSILELKRQLIGRRNEFIALQKLDELKKEVVPETELSDPLAIDPPKLVAVDYREGELIFRLSKIPSREWVGAFQGINYSVATLGYEPVNFRFVQANAVIACPEILVEGVAEDFKRFLRLAIPQYRSIKMAEHKRELENERKKLQKQVEDEETRQRILKQIKI